MMKYLPLFFLISNAFAVIDYSQVAPKSKTSRTSSSTWYKGMNMGASYEAISPKQAETNLVKLMAIYQTNFNVYLDTSFWAGKNGGDSFGAGNMEAKVGFNWLKMGNTHDLATLDMVAGVNFSSWDSNYASGRLDQVYSLLSSKRFVSFLIGLGAEWRISGDSKIEEVASIGNVGTYFAMAGWEISSDIRFVLEGGIVSISPGEPNDSGNYLNEKMKYTYISPLLQLGIFSQLWVELGAAFKMNNEEYSDTLANARLYDLKGIYGNSLFTGIKYSL